MVKTLLLIIFIIMGSASSIGKQIGTTASGKPIHADANAERAAASAASQAASNNNASSGGGGGSSKKTTVTETNQGGGGGGGSKTVTTTKMGTSTKGIEDMSFKKLQEAAAKYGKATVFKALSSQFGYEAAKTYLQDLVSNKVFEVTPVVDNMRALKENQTNQNAFETEVMGDKGGDMTNRAGVDYTDGNEGQGTAADTLGLSPSADVIAGMGASIENAYRGYAGIDKSQDKPAPAKGQAPGAVATTTTTTQTFKQPTQKQIQGITGAWNTILEKFGGDEEKARAGIIKEFEKKGYSTENIFSGVDANKKPEAPKSEIPFVNDVVTYFNEGRERNLGVLEESNMKVTAELDALKQTNKEVGENLEAINAQRMAQTNQAYDQIFASINELNKKADELFNKEVENNTRQRMYRLAEKGLLTDAQASQSAEFALADYKANAELAKKELIMKQQENIVNAMKEKQTAVDSILAQQGIDEVTKQNMIAQVTEFYTNHINTYTTNVTSINNSIDTTIGNVLAKQIELDINQELPLIEQKIKETLSTEEKANLKQNPQSMYQYVIKQLQSISPDLVIHASQYLNGLVQADTIESYDPDKLVAEATYKAYEDFKNFQIQKIKA